MEEMNVCDVNKINFLGTEAECRSGYLYSINSVKCIDDVKLDDYI